MSRPSMFILDKRIGQGDHEINPGWVVWAQAHITKLAQDLQALIIDHEVMRKRMESYEARVKALEPRIINLLKCSDCSKDVPFCPKDECLFPDMRGDNDYFAEPEKEPEETGAIKAEAPFVPKEVNEDDKVPERVEEEAEDEEEGEGEEKEGGEEE